jgi:hypothetical protein
VAFKQQQQQQIEGVCWGFGVVIKQQQQQQQQQEGLW